MLLFFCCRAVASGADNPLAVIDAAVEASEDAPRVASDYTFLPGDYLYFTFRIAGFSVKSENRDETRRISVAYEITPQDANGVALAETLSGKVEAELSAEDKNWLPKRRVSFIIPSFIAAGECHLHVLLKDMFANTSAASDFPFRVGGAKVEPSSALTVQNFEFLRNENDRVPLTVSAYSPGDTVYARFNMLGYKLGPGNSYHLSYGIVVLRPNGKSFFEEPKAADLAAGSFYPAQFLPGVLSLTTSPDTPHGEYIIVVTVRDLIGNQSFETRHAFSVE